ncbi:MAG: META domain-containing protein [Alphaproteobacteria bacterium]|jgi:heat shock protein HslJ|nr:META domain-containing protein [Alphaproteobacteria bacterium]
MPIRATLPCAILAMLILAAGCGGEGTGPRNGGDMTSDPAADAPTSRTQQGPDEAGPGPSSTPADPAVDPAAMASRPLEGFTLPFIASGHEPGWRLEIGEARIRLDRPDGQDALKVETPDAQLSDGERVYLADAGEKRLRARIEETLCQTPHDRLPHPYRVEVALGEDMLTGCGGNPARFLTGQEWVVETLNTDPLVRQTRMSIRFEPDGTVSGYDSCNTIGGSWSIGDSGLEIRPLASTRKLCPDPLAPQQSTFTEILETAGKFSFTDGGALIIHGADGQQLKARRG